MCLVQLDPRGVRAALGWRRAGSVGALIARVCHIRLGLCPGGGDYISDLTESLSNAVQQCVFCLLAFKGDLQADSQQES